MRFRRFKLNKRKILTITTIVVVFVMSLGYAALSQHMDIDGIASIDRNWIVKITDVTVAKNAGQDVSHNYVGTTVTMNVLLPTEASSVTYTITLENQGNLPAKLSTIDAIEDENYSIEYEITGVKTSYTTLNPGETNTAKVTIKYKGEIVNASSMEKSLMLTFNYIENSGQNGANSGDSTSTSEYIAYKPGDAVTFDPGDGTERLFYVISTSDTTSSTTVQLIAHQAVTTTTTASAASSSLSSTLSTWTKVSSKRLPTMAEMASLSGFTFDSSKDYGSSDVITQDWLIGPGGAQTITSTTKNGSYYTVVNVANTGIIQMASASTSVSLRPVITVSKSNLNAKYSTYKIGDQVTLVNGDVGYVTKDSGTSNAMLTVLLKDNQFTRAFDTNSTVTTTYDPTSKTNIGYYLNNTYIINLKSELNSAGGDSTGASARLLTLDEYNTLNDRGLGGDALGTGSFYLMTPSSYSLSYIVSSGALSTSAPTASLSNKPVVTILKDNIENVDLGVRISKIDNTASSDSTIDFSKGSTYQSNYRSVVSPVTNSLTIGNYQYGSSYSFDETTGQYTLVDATSLGSAVISLIAEQYPYTCLSSSTTCSTMYKVTDSYSGSTADVYTYTSTNVKYFTESPATTTSSQTFTETSTYYFGTGYTFDTSTGYYTLSGTTSGTWSSMSSKYTAFSYTCKKTTNEPCTTMYKMASYTSTTAGTAYTYSRNSIYDIGNNGDGLFVTSTNTLDNEPTYYFRGDVENNYVKFANHYWRILRVNEDGNVRLIYQGTTATATGSSAAIGKSAYNATNTDNAYVGYMYGTIGASNATAGTTSAHYPNTKSLINTTLNGWYEDNLSSFEDYIADSGFCNDRVVASGTGYSTGASNYAWYTNRQSSPKFSPCSGTYIGRDLFTTSSSSIGNKALSYPIGLITADEAIYAGAAANSSSYSVSPQKVFLYTGVSFWTMTPARYSSGAFVAYLNSSMKVSQVLVTSTSYYVRPVINIKADVASISGNGTATNPYVIS